MTMKAMPLSAAMCVQSPDDVGLHGLQLCQKPAMHLARQGDALLFPEVFRAQRAGVEETYPLKLLAPRDLSEEDRPRWDQELFYARLHAVSYGNLEGAGILFCRSTRWSEQLQKAFVLPIPEIPMAEALASYPRTSQLALGMLLEHELLTREELGELLLLSPGHAQTILDTFVRHSVVSRAEAGCYSVNTPWLGAIAEHLGRWNVL